MDALRRRFACAPLAGFGAWTGAALAQPFRRLQVVASFSILADMVRIVAGDAADVTMLVGPDADAHVFEPTPADARRIAAADLVMVNGLGFEGWLDRLVSASGTRGRIVVASSGIVPRRHGRESDPHAWQDLGHAGRYVANVQAALAAARPEQAVAFGRRAEQYQQSLKALYSEVRACFEPIPRSRRRVITTHDAFGYFGATYGIDFIAPQGMTTESEPSAATVARIADQIRREGIRAIFVENITDPRLVERLAKEGGATVGGRLYSDALSPPGTVADTYLKLFAHNATTIAAGLQGKRTALHSPRIGSVESIERIFA